MGVNDTFEFDVLVNTREIVVSGEINDELYVKLVKNILLLAGDSKKPIKIYLNSVGGDMYCGIGIYDLIKSLPFEVTIIVLGEACSVASLILQAADHRLISPTSIIMLHEWSQSADNTGTNLRNNIKINEKTFKKMVDIYAERCTITRTQLLYKMRADWFLTSEEALSMGLVDNLYE